MGVSTRRRRPNLPGPPLASFCSPAASSAPAADVTRWHRCSGGRSGGEEAGQDAVLAALPDGSDFREPRRAQPVDVGGQLDGLRPVVVLAQPALLTLGQRAGQRRIRLDRLPPALPGLRQAAGEAALLLP